MEPLFLRLRNDFWFHKIYIFVQRKVSMHVKSSYLPIFGPGVF